MNKAALECNVQIIPKRHVEKVKQSHYNDGMKKVIVIDGQGGSIGRAIVQQLSECSDSQLEITCIGTNSAATANMLKGGAAKGATGENPIIVACRNADYIVGPIGIVLADSMLGEITPRMANAIGSSAAHKILIPVHKCVTVAGVEALSLTEFIKLAVKAIENQESA